ncbi:MAG: thiamine pyrophosphate-dependent enzyme [Pseudomonadota bacterium]
MLTLDRPELGFVHMAKGMGVDGLRVDEADAFFKALETGLSSPGPFLIEAMI